MFQADSNYLKSFAAATALRYCTPRRESPHPPRTAGRESIQLDTSMRRQWNDVSGVNNEVRTPSVAPLVSDGNATTKRFLFGEGPPPARAPVASGASVARAQAKSESPQGIVETPWFRDLFSEAEREAVSKRHSLPAEDVPKPTRVPPPTPQPLPTGGKRHSPPRPKSVSPTPTTRPSLVRSSVDDDHVVSPLSETKSVSPPRHSSLSVGSGPLSVVTPATAEWNRIDDAARRRLEALERKLVVHQNDHVKQRAALTLEVDRARWENDQAEFQLRRSWSPLLRQ